MPKELDIIVAHVSSLGFSDVQESAVMLAVLAAFQAGQKAPTT